MDKPLQFWIALIVGMAIVYERNREKPKKSRAIMAAISGGMGYALAPELAQWVGRSEIIAAMLVSALGFLVIDVAASLIANRELIKEIVKMRLGGGGK